jgi:pyruvate/2-oxoglutarate dehydrogenase complex dihydrolipoamide acyltransferase (E2) component
VDGQPLDPAPLAEGRAGEQSLDYAERWMRDSLDILRPAFSVQQVTVDMTWAMQRLDDFRRRGVAATPTHLLVHAAARTLARNPDLHQLVAGTHRHRPTHVDIGVSVTGEIFVAPVLVIESAELKSVEEIVADMAERVAHVQKADREMLARLRRWGWLVPFAFLRRALLRTMFARPQQRRKVAGTFQISVVPADWALSSAFVAAGVLIAGSVRGRVVPLEGQCVVRPTMLLTLSADHGVWDGRASSRLLAGVKSLLEAIEAAPAV